MSFLAQSTLRRVAALNMPRALQATAPRAAFSTGKTLQKSMAESAKDAVKKVDRVVSEKLVDGIDAGADMANKAKQVGADMTNGNASGQADKLRGEAAGKANEVAGRVKGAAKEVEGKVKGKVDEVKRGL